MKKIFTCIALGICSIELHAQNVGINTTSPQASLDVRGTQRVGGINNYTRYDSATGRIEWVGAALYAPVSQQIIRHSTTSEGLYAGGGKLQYKNDLGNPVFFSDWTSGVGFFSSRLGIGTTTPFCPLAFADNLGEKISLYGVSTPNYGFAIQPYTFQMHVDAPASDIAFGTGSSASFNELMRIKGTGNVGIGNSSPLAPLSFNDNLGEKISFGGNSTNHGGIGTQFGLLQMFTKSVNEDIVFGYGSSAGFTETMRVTGLANVGIGVYPFFTLDIGGRMRIRSNGLGSNTSGLWLDNSSHTTAAFVGMEDDSHVGFYGGAGWNFSMNTQTGAFKINGNEGSSGQVLQSNGGSNSPAWASSTNALYNNTVSITNNTSFTLSQSTGRAPIPGMSYTFTLNGAAKVFVSYSIPIQALSCFACGGSTAYTEISVDGSLSGTIRTDIGNGQFANMASSKVFTLASGSHTIYIGGWVFGPDVAYGPCCIFEKVMNIQIIPQ